MFWLLAFLANYDKVVQAGRNCCKEIFKTPGKHWGLAVIGFFHSQHKSEIILHELVYLTLRYFYYYAVYWLVNVQVVKFILSGPFIHLKLSKIKTNNWFGLATNTSSKLIFSYLAMANLCYGLFKELFKRLFPLHLYSFSEPCYYGL